ncbi:serine/threonine-protein kinase [Kitasatospora sp. GP82]|uniref:serine/threonine-protein kinase n=1 Tax=Kitasatospora sp. GP82 TaxID=3035089 RepID=UPI002474AD70|nr:serine/threonine-protein kinase [Kitasatospora sp. GP82]MDH6124231.1 serine/threonine protein kinase [Kitasatospora sp. GP82]
MTQPQGSTGRLLAGRYRLNEVLGRGGMGTVWRAEDELLGRIVAVKELRMQGGTDEDEKHRLIVRTLREAKATARIRHTAAVTVFDVVEEDERPWIVMELVESRSLAEVIKEEGTLSPGRAAEIALDVLGVLGAAHSQGILHRDVKPSNVLIGEDGRVVLTDFGIASVEGDASITSTGMLVGAPSYISPERARGQKPGPPADLWSLGGTLYAMVEGRPPYDRGSALATLTAVMTETLPVPEKAGPLQPVIEGLLEKDPARRLDASTTRSMLKRIVAQETSKAEATTQQAVPPPVVDAPSVEPKKPGKPEKAEETGKAAQAVEAEGVKGPEGAKTEGSKRRVSGLLGTVRVGSRSAEPPAAASIPGPAPAPVAAPAPAPIPVPPSAAPPGERGFAQRPAVLAGAALVVVLLVVAVLFVLLRDKADGAQSAKSSAGVAASALSPSPSASKAAAAPPATTPGAASQSAAVSPSTRPPASNPPATPVNSAAAPGTDMPAGFHRYTDPSGFSIVIPDWLENQGVDSSGRTFEGNGAKLVVAWTDEPGKSALGAWQEEEKSASGGWNNYQPIQMKQITYRQWSNAADWEWTFGSKTTLHSLNRGFVTGKYGYALYWTIPDEAWNAPANAQAREIGFSSFQPAS